MTNVDDLKSTRVLVLGGGPDAERDVSLQSSRGVADALASTCDMTYRVIERIEPSDVLGFDVVFPVLHGQYGEGGPLQDLLEASGVPYVGSGPRASRRSMDKIASKLEASRLGIRTPEAVVLNVLDEAPPFEEPFVVKPVHDGSSVGLYLCHDDEDWRRAIGKVRADLRSRPDRSYMAERMVVGREVTVGLLGDEALPLLEIRPASGPYDYDAKYVRDDTTYVLEPDVPEPDRIASEARRIASSLGVRHLGRVDFFVDGEGVAWFLEINTMPGFTSHSLVPKAAAARGLSFEGLCERLVRLAIGTPTCR